MTQNLTGIYKGREARDVPAYPIAEAARYLRLAPTTLRSWVKGRAYPRQGGTGHFKPLIRLPNRGEPLLSFANLVEAHVLRALRADHGVSIKAVRHALDFAEKAYGIRQLLISPELRTDAGELLLDKYGELVNLSRSGQLAMRRILEAHLKRVEWGPHRFPTRLYPFVRPDFAETPKVIAIDPEIAFGRPVVLRKGISTGAIADRIDSGETVEQVAADYDLEGWEVEDAVLYERAA